MSAPDDDGPPLFSIDYSDESDADRLQAAGLAIEKAIERGNVELAQVLRAVVEVRSAIVNDAIYDDDNNGSYDGGKLLGLIRHLAEGVRVLAQHAPHQSPTPPTPSPTIEDFARRARALCADLMSFEIDGNLSQRADDLRDLQLEARSLLTGEPIARLKAQ